MPLPLLNEFPDYFYGYRWGDDRERTKHRAFGYPPDHQPEFKWIKSLENRFAWLRDNYATEQTAGIGLLREMIQWGGSQGGRLEAFDLAIGEKNLFSILSRAIENLDNPEKAINYALELPGMGLTYASKVLRFLDPQRYGALDGRLIGAFKKQGAGSPILPIPTERKKKDGICAGYRSFIDYLEQTRVSLRRASVQRPSCCLSPSVDGGWRAADIEMALFAWAESVK